jgi:type 1 fimbriae regulatory protein FimB/type 1 fimbriae regulatory protein FimE
MCSTGRPVGVCHCYFVPSIEATAEAEYALANAGHDTRAIQDWLGHRAIQHTARYTELSQERFKDFWRV